MGEAMRKARGRGRFAAAAVVVAVAAAATAARAADVEPNAGSCALVGPCGDVNASGKVTSSDALALLKVAVGQPQQLSCECGGSGSANPATPLVTGQTTCWDSAGASQSCAGSGQDGDGLHGVARAYADNGDGTITDQSTGLMWEKLSLDGGIHDADVKYTWDEAFAVKIAGLNSAVFAGYSDWRLPNIRELESLRDFGNVNPAVAGVFNSACAGGCTIDTCSCTHAFQHWSSTTAQDFHAYALYVNFGVGGISADTKTARMRVRAVRTAS